MRGILNRIAALSFLAIVALPLGACQTVGDVAEKISAVAGYTVTQNQIDAVRQSYNATYLAPAANYRELPKCVAGTSFNLLTNRCRDNDIVRQLQAADQTILAKFTKLQTALDSGDKPGTVSALAAVKASVEAAVSIITTYKINQL